MLKNGQRKKVILIPECVLIGHTGGVGAQPGEQHLFGHTGQGREERLQPWHLSLSGGQEFQRGSLGFTQTLLDK